MTYNCVSLCFYRAFESVTGTSPRALIRMLAEVREK